MSDLLTQLHTDSLGSLASMRRGITYSADMLVEREAGIPYINMKSFKKGGGFNSDGIKYYRGSFTPDDLSNTSDLLLANTDVTLDGDIVGIPAFLPSEFREEPVLYSHHVTRLRLDKKIDSEYLFYLLCIDKYRRWMLKFARGTTVLMLDMTAIKRIPIEYHLKKTYQDKIISILRNIDTTIEKTEALIEKYQQIKTGLMHDLFTHGIGADGKLRPPREQAPELYQESPIGWLPKEWNIRSLTSIASYQHGRPFPSTDYSNEGILLLRPGNLHISGYVLFDDAHSTRIPESWKKAAPGYIVTKGDILMNLTAQSLDDEFLGRVCLYEDTECSLLNQRIARFKALSVEHEFLYWILRSKQFRKQIDNTSQGTKVQHLYNRDLDRVKLGIPNKLEEQVEIALRLNKISEKVHAEIDSLQKLKQQKSGLMHDLLTGKVTVKIESDKPNDNKDQDIIKKLNQTSEAAQDSDCKQVREYV